ncbi:hypothetical protein BC826DRAFT_1023343 [Russula brevipes]|nr:hypothetical protein BC826DRAFT_1023343 [Russula brevipes]
MPPHISSKSNTRSSCNATNPTSTGKNSRRYVAPRQPPPRCSQSAAQSGAYLYPQIPKPANHGGTSAGMQPHPTTSRIPCRTCGSLYRREEMGPSSEFCSEEHRSYWSYWSRHRS